MDHAGKIAELVDVLKDRGVTRIVVDGYAGLGVLELTLSLSNGSESSSMTVEEDMRDSFEDIQYAASGVVPVNYKELYK